ncbi:MAG TPA: hypothetical protein VGH49_08000 [Xanthobacteraceae bacterium]|jgi:hypothetical protein
MPRNSDKRKVVVVAVLLGSVLAGCSDLYYDRRETVTFAADEAVASAQATQIIDPWPAAAANRAHTSNGARVAGAIERYRTGQIIEPKGTDTNTSYGAAPQTGQGGGAPSTSSASSSAKQ